MTRPRLRTLGVLLAAALLAGAIVAAPASAKLKTKVSTVEVSYKRGKNPNNPANCSVIGVAAIPLNLGAQTAKVRYRVSAEGGSFVAQEVVSPGPLFDSDLLYVKEYNAGKQTMWLLVTSSASAGGDENACKDLEARLKQLVRPTVRVTLTYEDDEDKVCGQMRVLQEETATAHRKALRAWNKLPAGGAKDLAKQFSDYTQSRWERAKQYRKDACEVSFG